MSLHNDQWAQQVSDWNITNSLFSISPVCLWKIMVITKKIILYQYSLEDYFDLHL